MRRAVFPFTVSLWGHLKLNVAESMFALNTDCAIVAGAMT